MGISIFFTNFEEVRHIKKKITWDDVYKDFRQHFPKRVKNVNGFKPHDYATILIFFSDGSRATYNYDTKIIDIQK